jgi:transposase
MPPTATEEALRQLVSLKRFVTKQRTPAVNRLHALYAQAGIRDLKKRSLATAADREQQKGRLAAPLLQGLARVLEQELGLYEEQLDRLERQLQEQVRGHELAPYILSVPGAGMGVTAAFLAYVGGRAPI